MNMKGLIAATLVVIVPASLHAQEPLIPQNFLQTAPEAYYHYEPNVLECVEWLKPAPKRQRLSRCWDSARRLPKKPYNPS